MTQQTMSIDMVISAVDSVCVYACVAAQTLFHFYIYLMTCYGKWMLLAVVVLLL